MEGIRGLGWIRIRPVLHGADALRRTPRVTPGGLRADAAARHAPGVEIPRVDPAVVLTAVTQAATRKLGLLFRAH